MFSVTERRNGMASRGPTPERKAGRKAPPVERPACPNWLDDEGVAEWNRLCPLLEDAGLMTKLDRAALAAYCQAWAELIVCTTELQTAGRFIKTPIQSAKGEVVGEKTVPHPALAAQRDALSRVRQYLGDLGLTPYARKRMGMGGDGGEESDDLMRLLSGSADS